MPESSKDIAQSEWKLQRGCVKFVRYCGLMARNWTTSAHPLISQMSSVWKLFPLSHPLFLPDLNSTFELQCKPEKCVEIELKVCHPPRPVRPLLTKFVLYILQALDLQISSFYSQPLAFLGVPASLQQWPLVWWTCYPISKCFVLRSETDYFSPSKAWWAPPFHSWPLGSESWCMTAQESKGYM